MRDRTPPGFLKVARLSEIPEKKGKRITAGDEEIALWRVDGRIYAINNVCSHQHVSALHQGTLDGLHVRCPMHGWTYSLESGRTGNGSGMVKIYQVRVQGDDIYIHLPPEG
jgi:3-phenylpropionate/trans-cinnamate dioxygenase ferredoxin subunit